ncbi:MAG: ABC transporter substrate-binding protein, partial [Stackebrandtia sp.]
GLYYANTLEAYRSDRWSGFVTQPTDGGPIRMQQGMWGYYSGEPVTGSESGPPGWALIAVGVVAVVVVAGGIWWWGRRRATVVDRE